MTIRAGVAKREITPSIDAPTGGLHGGHFQSITDPLWAKAVALMSEDTCAVLVSVDLPLLPDAFVADVREAIAAALGAAPQGIVLCTNHTHSAPFVDLTPEADPYLERIKGEIVAAAEVAQRLSVPVRVHYAAARREDLSHNRRFVMRDGSVVTHPERDEDVLHPDGPIDPEIQAVLLSDAQERPLAVLVGFACHPTAMGWRERTVSADYPYWIVQEVQADLGAQTEVLFFPGALGDVSDGQAWHRQAEAGLPLAEKIGREEGREVLGALATERVELYPPLFVSEGCLRVPTVEMDLERLRWARQVLETAEEQDSWEMRDARLMMEIFRFWRYWPDEVQTELSLISIGELAFYGIQGELFAWYGLQLKARSRFRHPFILGLANGRIGYIADRVFLTKDILNVPLHFHERRFGEKDDAGERIVKAALQL